MKDGNFELIIGAVVGLIMGIMVGITIGFSRDITSKAPITHNAIKITNNDTLYILER